ncbi:DUF4282 domain-containing protein [Propioniciclava tarda]|uniref:DUF4282 domain-containing protein n=1 Tax=Propioniciclava tarda TaxID=433330 RepID=A0A4Q9KJ59_PROTD|nr:DUF4282 domain-containing protein [Propioniciclava tarda]TBT93192.1 DUF4282 domain-containing protein [Propioniciclava tarda]SMO76745.1 protein of unknown function [Propioniciclava tarda]HOA88123.1 DUF4282 domain-containing protein [Propioniciclava tarda]HQA30195.1 DUF4282 domain-containing protein [Propioniciclava tarda]HQD59904.1 DUF4282 domain-containing protein [Propioniciclava tarda]
MTSNPIDPTWDAPQSGPGGPSAPTPQPDLMAQSKGLLGSLFDLSFRHYATPHIVRIVYILLMVLVGLGAIGGLVTAIGLFRFSPLMGLLYLIATPVVSVVFLALCRMSMEMYVAICRAAEDLDQLKRKLGN